MVGAEVAEAVRKKRCWHFPPLRRKEPEFNENRVGCPAYVHSFVCSFACLAAMFQLFYFVFLCQAMATMPTFATRTNPTGFSIPPDDFFFFCNQDPVLEGGPDTGVHFVLICMGMEELCVSLLCSISNAETCQLCKWGETGINYWYLSGQRNMNIGFLHRRNSGQTTVMRWRIVCWWQTFAINWKMERQRFCVSPDWKMLNIFVRLWTVVNNINIYSQH